MISFYSLVCMYNHLKELLCLCYLRTRGGGSSSMQPKKDEPDTGSRDGLCFLGVFTADWGEGCYKGIFSWCPFANTCHLIPHLLHL